eukprot:COSAG05_NODE_3850_length_1808_cov_1.038619_1_plen_85_part_00
MAARLDRAFRYGISADIVADLELWHHFDIGGGDDGADAAAEPEPDDGLGGVPSFQGTASRSRSHTIRPAHLWHLPAVSPVPIVV